MQIIKKKSPHWQRQIGWLFASVAEGLNSGGGATKKQIQVVVRAELEPSLTR